MNGSAPRNTGRKLCVCAVFVASVLATVFAGSSYAQAPQAPQAATAGRAQALLRELGAEVPAAMRATRELLIGKWTPDNPSCVAYLAVGDVQSGRVKGLAMNPEGGIGMRLASLYLGPSRGKDPKTDYYWHQGLYRKVLTNQAADARKGLALHAPLSAKAAELAAFFAGQASWPDSLEPLKLDDENSLWPLYCLDKLNDAVAAKDLPAARTWSRELAGAAFAMEDLLKWAEFLLNNQLASLDFQAKCEPLFISTENAFVDKYVPQGDIGGYPGGTLGLHQLENYLEVEHQAEQLYSVPDRYVSTLAKDANTLPAARLLPPDVRGAFAQLREKLSPANRTTWDRAAVAPFERSYMANMLYRSQRAEVIERVGVALERLDAADKAATVDALMDAIFYRGGTPLAGLEWADRYDQRLMDNAKDITGLPGQALTAAYQRMRQMMANKATYASVLTLREAMDTRRLDCIRATDMIGSLYRNAGKGGFLSIRWCAGQEAHTIAAVEVDRESRHIAIIDGLAGAPTMLETWPSAFYRGHDWPAALRINADIYAVELSGRGLDNYVWMEGYIVRGPSAGELTRAEIPYRDDCPKTTSEKVFAGPYPDAKASK